MIPETKGIWWSGGQRWLDELQLADAYTNRIGSLRDLIELNAREITQSDTRIHGRLKGHPGYEAIQRIAGVGRVLGAVFVAEIGDVHRFPDARHLCSWAGLTPRLRESDAHTRRGHITKQGDPGRGLGDPGIHVRRSTAMARSDRRPRARRRPPVRTGHARSYLW